MGRKRTQERDARRVETLQQWADGRGINLRRLDLGQQWVVFAALGVVTAVASVAPLKRVLGYLLAHSGMDLGPKVIAAIVGVSDRAVRSAQALAPRDMLHSVRHPVGGHRKPKLKAEHAGVVAKFLVEHPGAQVVQVLEFIRGSVGVVLDRLTFRHFVKRYGLGCLRGDLVADTPLFSVEPRSAEPSSCSATQCGSTASPSSASPS